jgi:hypothetical protein
MTYADRLTNLYTLARRPTHLPITPDAGPAVVAWYESLDRKPSTIDLLDMLAWALIDLRNLDGETSCKSCGWSGTHQQAREHFTINPETQQYACGRA